MESPTSTDPTHTTTTTIIAPKHLLLTYPHGWNFLKLRRSFQSLSEILVAELLTTENYPTWSCFMQCGLRAENKLRFINRVLTPPTDDLLFGSWEHCNNMVGRGSTILFPCSSCQVLHSLTTLLRLGLNSRIDFHSVTVLAYMNRKKYSPISLKIKNR